MKTRIGIFTLAMLAMTGCGHTQHVENTLKQRIDGIRDITVAGIESRERTPDFQLVVTLPPGTYNVPEGGWELVNTTYRTPINTMVETAVKEMGNYGISEPVAITALRVGAPLVGFIAGQYFTNEALKTSLNAVVQMSNGVFDFASTAYTNPPAPLVIRE
jgi:hypothetical protein